MAPSCGYIALFSKWLVLCSTMLQLQLLLEHTVAGLSLKSDGGGEQPLKPGNTVPAFPVQTQTQTCRLDLSDELFGGVDEACGHNLDRSRCFPVLPAWLFSAHAQTELQVPAPVPASSSSPSSSSDLPMMPDDSQKCVNSLQSSLQSRDIHLPQLNASCDAILCFCGIRLHQITSLSCPAAFNVSSYRSAWSTTAETRPTPAALAASNPSKRYSSLTTFYLLPLPPNSLITMSLTISHPNPTHSMISDFCSVSPIHRFCYSSRD